MLKEQFMSGNKSLILYSNGLFKIKPTELVAVCSVNKTIALLKELSFRMAGSATNNLPFLGCSLDM